DRLARADHCSDGLATKARFTIGEHRLILDAGIDAEAIGRYIASRQYARNAARALHEFSDVAELETAAVMRRADHAHPERIARDCIGAIGFGAGQLRCAVDLRRACADCLSDS